MQLKKITDLLTQKKNLNYIATEVALQWPKHGGVTAPPTTKVEKPKRKECGLTRGFMNDVITAMEGNACTQATTQN